MGLERALWVFEQASVVCFCEQSERSELCEASIDKSCTKEILSV